MEGLIYFVYAVCERRLALKRFVLKKVTYKGTTSLCLFERGMVIRGTLDLGEFGQS